MCVIGIETSCDETGIALYEEGEGLIAHALHSQIPLHACHGGVVPEIASRDHVRKVLPLIRQVLEEGSRTLKDVQGIAYTAGPGLMGALMVGAAIGRSLAFGLGIPSIGVHHMEAHLLAPMLEERPPSFPFLALLVSGGHTLLVAVEGVGRYRVMGESLDDAAGEAFDKVAKMLGLGYPGGPAIARAAKEGREGRFVFPRPMTQRAGLDFSFSGLKTHVMKAIREAGEGAEGDIAYAFQEAVVDTLAIKCQRALEATGYKRLVVAGGVGANARLRERLASLGVPVFYPRPAFCTDNGAMVAYAGYLRLRAGERDGPGFSVRPRWSLEALSPIPA